MTTPRDPQPERTVRDLERRSERLGDHIDEARADWERKKADESVPGARPDPGEEPPPSEVREGETPPGGPG